MSAVLQEPFAIIRKMSEADIPAVLEVECRAYTHPWTEGILRDCLRVRYQTREAPYLRDHLHPDAGKTTLTEKLLLFGGAIQLAGTVKGRKAARHATSDWMELEKQRGISVTSSVMQFPLQGRSSTCSTRRATRTSRRTPTAP
jgi:hypothetical protein